jgi:O-succinylbenzoate synthase
MGNYGNFVFKRFIMAVSKAYEEVIDFIAEGTTPDSIVVFRPSEAAKQRVADLIRREKTTGLTADETSELNHYMELEHLKRLAKTRARKHI